MLQIIVPPIENWDERKQEFVTIGSYQTLTLEHSLVSISKWESKWCKAFLRENNKTEEELLDYIKCMTITQNVNPEVYDRLTPDNIEQVNSYINSPMTATTFSAEGKSGGRSNEVVTSELIYYWMVALNIPFKCEKWHINRLITLIKVCNIKNAPPKKRSKRELTSRNAALNEARRKKYNTKG